MNAVVPCDDFYLLECLEVLQSDVDQNLFRAMFPDKDSIWLGATNPAFKHGATIYAREKYPRHLEFFWAGSKYRERAAIAANRTGKTLGMGGYEMACHLTGMYPHWWEGRRFTTPIDAWAAGKRNETTRDIIQATLLGTVKHIDGKKAVSGTGLIPASTINPNSITWKQGVSDLVDTAKIKHVSGGWSSLGLKAYEQGRGAFEGTSKDLIWLDEECPQDVYGECLIRTATTNGIVMLTWTPLDGITPVVASFLPHDERPPEYSL